MKISTLPKVGSILSDHTGTPCVVIKSWSWEDRIAVLKNGCVTLEMIANLHDFDLSDILNNQRNNQVKNVGV
jgi:hypothetical protein